MRIPSTAGSCLFAMVVLCAQAHAQPRPADFEVFAVSGGLFPHDPTTSVRIAPDGHGRFARYYSDEPEASPDTTVFDLGASEMDQLWDAFAANGFFSLDPEYGGGWAGDGVFIQLEAVADGIPHAVTAKNVTVEPLVGIMSTLNALIPRDDGMLFEMPEPFTVTIEDICSGQGKRPVPQQDKSGSADAGSLLAGSESAMAHLPGTMVGYRMSLKEAVDRGIVTLKAKGSIFGDGVSIHVNNTGNHTSDRLGVDMYLEFWGPESSSINAAAIEAAIEAKWSHLKTSSGMDVGFNVHTRWVLPGGLDMPHTPGYHKIELVPDAISIVDILPVNTGIGTGTWRTLGEELAEMFGHEAGHLLGLPDRRDDYIKRRNGSWRDLAGRPYTLSQVADSVQKYFPNLSHDELEQYLYTLDRITPPWKGSENDIMGNKTKYPLQSDIDELVDKAGLIIEVRPGDVLVNHAGRQQNMTITRSMDIFVPKGGTTTLEGLFATCIDRHEQVPYAGVPFDVAPSISQWRGVEGAQEFQQFLEHVNETEQFCAGSDARWAIWRITDDLDVAPDLVNELLLAAGIDLGDRTIGFPHLSPSISLDTTTVFHMPPELVVPEVVASPGDILDAGTPVSIDGIVHVPEGADLVASIEWWLDSPPGSAAALSASDGGSTGFTADVRGIYRVSMSADVTEPLAIPGTYGAYAPLVVADERTETFEGGTLEPGGPFFWRTGWPDSWSLTTRESHTGSASATSGDTEVGGTAVLRSGFEQPSEGPFSFAVKVGSGNIRDSLHVAVDGVVLGRWSWQTADWETVTFDLSPGTHTVSWTFLKHDSFGGGDYRRVWIDDVVFPPSAVFTSIDDGSGAVSPARFALHPNYPNPFNPSTRVVFDLPDASTVRLVVFDVMGREVARLADGLFKAGTHEVTWHAGTMPSGVYLVRLEAGVRTAARRMVLLK